MAGERVLHNCGMCEPLFVTVSGRIGWGVRYTGNSRGIEKEEDGKRVIMRIGFIGAGKVGCSLGKYLKESAGDWQIVGFYSRSTASAKEAAVFTDSRVIDQVELLAQMADVIFVTTPDGVIKEIWETLRGCDILLEDKIIVHCSGLLASTVFTGADECGVTAVSLHPLYAVSDKYHSYESLANAHFTLEGSGERLEEFQQLLTVSGLTIQQIDAASKAAYHAAASISSNLMVGLAELAIERLLDCGFDREHARMALRPLMQGNLDAIMEKDTTDALTGPAERADVETVNAHLHTLSGEDREIYRLLTKKVVAIAKQKNPERDYSALDASLEQAKDV